MDMASVKIEDEMGMGLRLNSVFSQKNEYIREMNDDWYDGNMIVNWIEIGDYNIIVLLMTWPL